MMNEIKLVTINTWKCDGDYDRRLQVMASQLEALKPHVVACQECFSSDEAGADTIAYLAATLGMNYCFLPGRLKKRLFGNKGVNSASGLGVLSSFGLKAYQQFDLPVDGHDYDRKVQQVEIFFPGDIRLLITNTHLTHVDQPTELRLKQARQLAAIVNLPSAHTYRFVCGDMNAEIGSTEISTFLSLTQATDCYQAGNGTEPRYSLADAYYKANKHICVDHIFAMPPQAGGNLPVFKNSGTVLNKADEATGVFASDHFGITTTLVIPQ